MLLTLDQETGELGPACIIGSGAYNLYAIIAVCTLSIKPGARTGGGAGATRGGGSWQCNLFEGGSMQ